jgi:broad specificity phosphatase PhoE
MIKLYFIRHGQSEYNKAGLLAGSTDTPLTDLGREQALAAGIAAKDLGVELMFASPLGRARETAEIMAGQMGYPAQNIIFDARLKERHFGSLEGTVWNYGVDLTGTAGLESIEHLHARVASVIADIRERPERSILIVAHGATGRLIREVTDATQAYKFNNTTVKSNNAEIIQLI